jgi:putative MATE family efflux protein
MKITEDKYSKIIFKLAWPIIVLNMLRAGFNIVDMFWLGRLGKGYIAGVSSSIFFVWAVYGMTALVTIGIVAIISRNIGEGRKELAKINTFNAINLSVLLGLSFTVITIPSIPYIIGLMGLTNDVYRIGVDYLSVILSGTILIFLVSALHSVFIAWGDSRTPLKVYIFTFIINIIASPLLMFGFWIIPRMETKGVALATLLSNLIAALIFSIIIIKRKWAKFAFSNKERAPFRNYIKIGYSIALAGGSFSFIYFYIAGVLATFGSEGIAALGIGHKVESINYFFGMGLASALATFTGQNIGANKLDRAYKGAIYTIKAVVIISLSYSIIMFIFAPQAVSIFTKDPLVIHYGVWYVRIIMLSGIFMSILVIIQDGAFSGSGYTWPAFVFSLPITALRIPLSYFFAITLNLGVKGVWIAIASTSTINALVFMYIFSKKKWLHQKV